MLARIVVISNVPSIRITVSKEESTSSGIYDTAFVRTSCNRPVKTFFKNIKIGITATITHNRTHKVTSV